MKLFKGHTYQNCTNDSLYDILEIKKNFYPIPKILMTTRNINITVYYPFVIP